MNNKNLKLIFVCFALCFVFASCYKNKVLGEINLPKASTESDIQIAVSPTPQTSQPAGLKGRTEDIIYSTVLETVFVYSSDKKYSELREPGIIGFRKISIVPTGFEEFAERNSFNLSAEILDEFKNTNRKKSVLEDRYDVKDAMASVVGEGNPKEILKTARTRKVKGIPREKIGLLIGLSKVGFSKDRSQALLYAEYTTANKYKKMYILVPLEITGNSIRVKREKIEIEFVPE